MEERGKAMVMAAFVADSLALGAHWIYDTEQIARTFGRVEALLKPGPDSYHATKEKGGFTHYGDQMFVLLKSLAAKGEFDLSDFSLRWQALFHDYDGYIDQATRGTRSNIEAGKPVEAAGSPSDDLAGATRVAPLIYCYRHDPEGLGRAAEAQTRLTHNSEATLAGASFFSEVGRRVLGGEPPTGAMEKVSEANFSSSSLSRWVAAGIQSKGEESVGVIQRFGQSCHTEAAFPGVVHLIARYEGDLKEALIQSVMAGGDSAARGMLVGMVLGAHLGPEGLPREWVSGLQKRGAIEKCLAALP